MVVVNVLPLFFLSQLVFERNRALQRERGTVSQGSTHLTLLDRVEGCFDSCTSTLGEIRTVISMRDS